MLDDDKTSFNVGHRFMCISTLSSRPIESTRDSFIKLLLLTIISDFLDIKILCSVDNTTFINYIDYNFLGESHQYISFSENVYQMAAQQVKISKLTLSSEVFVVSIAE